MSPSLQSIAQPDSLPSLPQVAMQVVEIAGQPEPDIQELARVISSDAVLAGKILKTVNSALFGLRGNVTSIDMAVTKLGVTLVRTLALSFNLTKVQTNQCPTPERFWKTSLAQAVMAESLAELSEREADSATYFLGGLLQSIGILAIWQAIPDLYDEQVLANSEYPSTLVAERHYFGFTHVDVGKAIWRRWGLPESLIHAMGGHHDLVDSAGCCRDTHLANALRAAHLFARYLETAYEPGHRQLDMLSCFLFERYGINAEQTEELINDCCIRIGELAAMFSFDVGREIDVQRISEDARRVLADIALQSQLQLIADRTDSATSDGSMPPPKEEALRDPLTGVYGRLFIDELLETHLEPRTRKAKAVGLLYLSIDEFRTLSEEAGRAVADEAVRMVASAVLNAVHRRDFAVRIGADTFLVALLRTSEDAASRTANRIRDQIGHGKIPSTNLDVSVSVGAVYYKPDRDDPESVCWLIPEAEQAMYSAQQRGGDQVCMYVLAGQNSLLEK